MSSYGNEMLRTIMKEPKTYFDMTMNKEEGCPHLDCGCTMHYSGKHPVLQGFEYDVSCGPPEKMEAALVEMCTLLKDKYMVDGNILMTSAQTDSEKNFFEVSIKKDQNISLTHPPMNVLSYPSSASLYQMDPAVERAVMMSDCLLRSDLPAELLLSNMQTTERNSLLSLCLDHIDSTYAMIKIKNKKKSGVIVATKDLYVDHKAAKAILLQQQPFVHKLKPEGEEVLKECLDESLDLLYNAMGTKHLFGTKKPGLSFDSLTGMYLGASKGLDICPIADRDGFTVNATDKKITSIESDMEAIIDFIENEEHEPAVYWNVVPKDEKFHYQTEKMSDEQYEAKLKKLRLFLIGNSVLVCMERMVSTLRQKLERGDVIAIGHSWARGGADEIARILKVKPKEPFKPNICEGDVSHIDVSIAAKFVDLCMSMAMVYEDKNDPDHQYRVRILRFVIKNLVCRLTHFFGAIWGFQRGGVPSGVFNTSHIDSWVMAIWYFLFVVHTIHNAPDDIAERLYSAAIDKLTIIVYGDDHLYTKGHEPDLEPYLSAHLFAKFMKEKFDVTLRDIKDGIPFASTHAGGRIISLGATFLRHQFVLNPLYKEGTFLQDGAQPMFLPYRESWEYMVRCVHGKSTKPRDVLDVAMASIGHAYGTYASNRDAYDRLKALYLCCLFELGVSNGTLPKSAMDRLRANDIRDLRRKGVEVADLMRGFPTWETLVQKNCYDKKYHVISRDITDIPEEEFVLNE